MQSNSSNANANASASASANASQTTIPPVYQLLELMCKMQHKAALSWAENMHELLRKADLPGLEIFAKLPDGYICTRVRFRDGRGLTIRRDRSGAFETMLLDAIPGSTFTDWSRKAGVVYDETLDYEMPMTKFHDSPEDVIEEVRRLHGILNK
jgi:hypothetical protein